MGTGHREAADEGACPNFCLCIFSFGLANTLPYFAAIAQAYVLGTVRLGKNLLL